MALQVRYAPEPIGLPALAQPQVAYAHVTIAAGIGNSLPLQMVIVADASRSMRIPIVSEEQFRELARSGGAHEVLVDGVPVWQLATPLTTESRASYPSALGYTSRALHSLIERLDKRDRLALIACASDAVVLAPATPGDRHSDLIAAVARLPSLRLGETTNLAQGLQLALAQSINSGEEAVRRIVLLTDGFTTDRTLCISLAREAATRGITISTIGLGGTFEEVLLTQLADLSGGRASFAREASDIPAIMAAELDAARRATTQAITVDVTLPHTVSLRHVTQLAPALTVLEPVSTEHGRRVTLYLGELQQGEETRLLWEFLVAPGPPNSQRRLARLRITSGSEMTQCDIIGHYTPNAVNPPPSLLPVISRAMIARLHYRATIARQRGDLIAASNALTQLATQLRAAGQNELAQIALSEAAAILQQTPTPTLTAKELSYATRRLRIE
ncbi:MAG: VWA domain-containing protein [Chloroflexus sp.]